MMYSGSVLDSPVSPRVMTTAERFLVKGTDEAREENVTGEADAKHNNPEPALACCSYPGEDLGREDQHGVTNEFSGESALDDGFRTPVSDNHKIMPVLKCPPAPKKPMMLPWRKRKLLPCDRRDHGVSLVIHVADEEVEAMFPSIVPSEDHNNKFVKALKRRKQ